MRRASAVTRIERESEAAVRVWSVVLMIRLTSPFFIMSTMCGRDLVRVTHADESAPALRQAHTGGDLRLDERLAERFANAHHLAGRLHLRSKHGVDAGELGEREHRLLHREI